MTVKSRAQIMSEVAQIRVQITDRIASNNNGDISAEDMRTVLNALAVSVQDLVDSTEFLP